MTEGFCEQPACGSGHGLTITTCGLVLCTSHAFGHRFCTNDVGLSGCVIANFVQAHKPIPETLTHRRLRKSKRATS